MDFLSRREEQVLLAVWDLDDEAYPLSIREYLSKITRKNWSIGIIHKPLVQLERKGYIKSNIGGATATRGGRRKKFYRVTTPGVDALKELKCEQDKIWKKFLSMELKEEWGKL
jgi:PadR family transcriptional regulator, regulatory protein PadR